MQRERERDHGIVAHFLLGQGKPQTYKLLPILYLEILLA
jgi:hypothetical protein